MNLFVGEKYFEFIKDIEGSVSKEVSLDDADKIIVTSDCDKANLAIKFAIEKKIPLLGIVDGYNAVIKAFGGELENIKVNTGVQEFAVIDATSPIYIELESVISVCRAESYAVCEPTKPNMLDCMSRAETGEIIGVRNKQKPKEYGHIYGINFDVESPLTLDGKKIIENFFKI